jgi:hypothetical protein
MKRAPAWSQEINSFLCSRHTLCNCGFCIINARFGVNNAIGVRVGKTLPSSTKQLLNVRPAYDVKAWLSRFGRCHFCHFALLKRRRQNIIKVAFSLCLPAMVTMRIAPSTPSPTSVTILPGLQTLIYSVITSQLPIHLAARNGFDTRHCPRLNLGLGES